MLPEIIAAMSSTSIFISFFSILKEFTI